MKVVVNAHDQAVTSAVMGDGRAGWEGQTIT